MPRKNADARRHRAALGLVVVLVVAVFGQTIAYPYNALDDADYVSNNPHIQDHLSWQVLRWNSTDIIVSNWHPVTMLSLALVAGIFGLDAGPQHSANVILHTLNACMLYAFLWRCTRRYWPSLLVAVLFAVHPLRVETVAWVSDRKGILAGFFVLVAMLAYERYVRDKRRSWYACVVLSFAFALLSKPTAIALPFALLLLDYWPLGRLQDSSRQGPSLWPKLLLEKMPLIALSALGALVTFIVQRNSGAVQDLQHYSLGVRVANAAVSYVMYLSNTLVPFHLAPQYPHPGTKVFGPGLYLSIVILGAVTFAAVRWRKRWPWLAIGWFWFCGMLVPAIGLVQVMHQARADRYTYLPLIGLLIVIAWTLDELCRLRPRIQQTVFAATTLWVAALTGATFVQTGRWVDDFTLYNYTLARAPTSSTAHYILGMKYLQRGDIESAEQHLRASIAHEPVTPEAFNNLAMIELQRGNNAQAAEHLANALSRVPAHVEWLVNYGGVLFNLGRYDDAAAAAKRALQAKPNHDRARVLLEACAAAGANHGR